jgi:pyruvate carboxylase
VGLGDKMEEIKKAYRDVNELFGDIVKVTPSSKVVGDMALFMVSNNLRKEDIIEKGETISFPESVISLFRGDIGQPAGGFDPVLQKKILKDIKPFTGRPNDQLKPVDLDASFTEFKSTFGEDVSHTDHLSWLLYPKVFEEYYSRKKEYGEVWHIPTLNFFYGLCDDEEVLIEIDKGKSILVRLLTCSEPDEEGKRKVFMRLNGQTRIIEIQDKKIQPLTEEHQKAEPGNAKQIAAPIQGKLSQVLVKEGDQVKQNQPLFVIEAMKMETTITSNNSGKVEKILLQPGKMVKADDLVIVMS